MKARIVMVGTQFSPAKDSENVLRVRIDLFPEPGEPGYESQLVNVPVRPLTEEEAGNPALATLVPTVQQVNPIVCRFEYVPPSWGLTQLRELMLRRLRETQRRLIAIEEAEIALAPALERANREWIGLEIYGSY